MESSSAVKVIAPSAGSFDGGRSDWAVAFWADASMLSVLLPAPVGAMSSTLDWAIACLASSLILIFAFSSVSTFREPCTPALILSDRILPLPGVRALVGTRLGEMGESMEEVESLSETSLSRAFEERPRPAPLSLSLSRSFSEALGEIEGATLTPPELQSAAFAGSGLMRAPLLVYLRRRWSASSRGDAKLPRADATSSVSSPTAVRSICEHISCPFTASPLIASTC